MEDPNYPSPTAWIETVNHNLLVYGTQIGILQADLEKAEDRIDKLEARLKELSCQTWPLDQHKSPFLED